MLKHRWSASRFFVTADLGASCLGWLSAFFAIAVVLGCLDQYKFLILPDILRRYIFQVVLMAALYSLYRKGWRASFSLSSRVGALTVSVVVLYFLGLKILDLIARHRGFIYSENAPNLEFSDQLFLSVLLAPIVEELFFRDIFFRTLFSRWPRIWIAILASSFFFMIAHQSFYMGAFLLGLVNGMLFVYSGSVIPGILFHSISNLSWYFLPKLFPSFYEVLRSQGLLTFFYHV
jgi:membrane protease YdiL (CAAX protease family)